MRVNRDKKRYQPTYIVISQLDEIADDIELSGILEVETYEDLFGYEYRSWRVI